MQTPKIFLALLLCSAALCQTNNCPGFNGGDLVETGSQSLVRGNAPWQPEYIFPVRVNYVIPGSTLDIAATTSTLAGFNPAVTPGFAYNLLGRRQGTTQYVELVLTIPQQSSWQSILINYIFCSRTDLAVGNFATDFFYWNALSAGVYEVKHGISNILPANQNYQVAAFVSGFSTTDGAFRISINQPYFVEADKTVGAIFSYKSAPDMTFITFSYIVYPRTHPVLKFDYSTTIPSDLGSYHLSGPVSLNPNSAISYNIWRIVNRNIPCSGANCGSSCILIESCTQRGGNYYKGQCFFCPDGILFEAGQCLRRCGAHQVYFNRLCFCDTGFVRQGVDCVQDKTCGTNQVWSDVSNKCVCDQNSIFYAQKCVRCPASSFPNPTQTSCDCTDVAKQYNELTNTCDNRCTAPNQSWQTDHCDCIAQYAWWNGNCRLCPADSAPNAAKTTCSCTSATQIFDANTNTCINCQANAEPNAGKTGCVCSSGYQLDQNNQCVVVPPVCVANEQYNPTTNTCDCVYGYYRVTPGTPCVSRCPVNEVWTGTACACAAGYARFSGLSCVLCPAGTTPNQERTTCLCAQSTDYFDASAVICQPCPANSAPTADDTACVCNAGWHFDANKVCISNCPSNSSPDALGNCVCNNKFYLDQGVCIPQPQCPANSQWNQAALQCVCSISGQHLINGICQTCPANEGWTGVQCICNAGLNRVNGVCVACSPNGFYNGKTCECNGNWFGDGTTCSACHPSCRTCTGADANLCTQCNDISLTLQNGYCIKVGPCDPGTYLNGATCDRCGENCKSCSSLFDCSTCATGFTPISIPFGGQSVTACQEICGDGTRFTEECDDGNTNNGDGCNEFCEIESGWSCNGGGALKPDFCTQNIPQNVILTSKGAVNLGSEVVLNVRANYLPPCMTNFQCNVCNEALAVIIVSSVNYANFSVAFNQFTKYQWRVTVTFTEVISTPFKISVKINPAYKNQPSCFALTDFDQELVVNILEPRDLITANSIASLNFNDL